jgi:hypothetical protein
MRMVQPHRLALACTTVALLALTPAIAPAALRGENESTAQRLIEACSPRLVLRAQEDPPCDIQEEQYQPTAVETVLGNPEVELTRR